MAAHLRMPLVAGRFYPSAPEALLAEVQAHLDKAADYRTECAGQPALGCMVPHAGYMFSGLVAGITLGQIPIPETVLILGPNHTGKGAPLALWPDGAWRTPLGDAPVDAAGVDRLIELGAGSKLGPAALLRRDTAAHTQDHAIEVVLPFLQALRPGLKIIPLCASARSDEGLPETGRVIAAFARERAAAGEPVLLVTSSDMSHYLPHDQGKALDYMALEQIQKLDAKGLFKICTQKRISMCGVIPMSIMLHACRELGASRCCVTAHTSSGVTGKDYGAKMSSVVGYAGVIID